ncbi:hypothetical protein AX774_g1768 [Zancudomyces culisetae]|uniref:Uncharacterized protein n=1 Tax=Zancudomyces culisetae TaxID=1213189 RepID=A0A1R1PUQ1_ZANCU|nr:hypothetical protein AX774_g1768 [Zancudomyces culisetae]|eukprot:OMH84701.1 hypothetical protein AX774_g1768 [Zancudomyces culisetae]
MRSMTRSNPHSESDEENDHSKGNLESLNEERRKLSELMHETILGLWMTCWWILVGITVGGLMSLLFTSSSDYNANNNNGIGSYNTSSGAGSSGLYLTIFYNVRDVPQSFSLLNNTVLPANINSAKGTPNDPTSYNTSSDIQSPNNLGPIDSYLGFNRDRNDTGNISVDQENGTANYLDSESESESESSTISLNKYIGVVSRAHAKISSKVCSFLNPISSKHNPNIYKAIVWYYYCIHGDNVIYVDYKDPNKDQSSKSEKKSEHSKTNKKKSNSIFSLSRLLPFYYNNEDVVNSAGNEYADAGLADNSSGDNISYEMLYGNNINLDYNKVFLTVMEWYAYRHCNVNITSITTAVPTTVQGASYKLFRDYDYYKIDFYKNNLDV